jgi:hypothetical protein
MAQVIISTGHDGDFDVAESAPDLATLPTLPRAATRHVTTGVVSVAALPDLGCSTS